MSFVISFFVKYFFAVFYAYFGQSFSIFRCNCTLLNSDSLCEMEIVEIETNIQEYFEVASTDWILLDELIDKGNEKSHRAVRSDQRIAINKNSALFRYMRNLYLTSLTTVSYERETSYLEDMDRGYVGVKVVAKLNISGNRLIPGLAGVVSSCPSNIDDTPDLNFSVFFRESSTLSLQGPLSFVNHSCRPNCRYETPKGKEGVVLIRSIKDIEEGQEITVSYGKNYFGVNKEHCRCPFTEEHKSRDVGLVFTTDSRSTRSGKVFSTVDTELDGCEEDNSYCEFLNVSSHSVSMPPPLVDHYVIENSQPTVLEDISTTQNNDNFICSARSSRRNVCDSLDTVTYNDSRILYETICHFCPKIVKLNNGNFLSHLRDKHRLEAEFKCFSCSRLFSGFNSFVNHVKKHELEMAQEFAKEIENILSQSQNLSENNEHPSESLVGSLQDTSLCLSEDLSNRGILSSSFLGKKEPRVYEWCKKLLDCNSTTAAFSCKFLNCSFKNLTLKNYTSHLSNYHGSASSFECLFCPRQFGSLKYLFKHTRKFHGSPQPKEDETLCNFPEMTEDYSPYFSVFRR